VVSEQRSLVAAKADNFREKAKERQRASGGDQSKKAVKENLPEPNLQARDEAGKAFGVSGKSVDHAAKVLKHGSKELIGALETGKIAVSTAAKLSTRAASRKRPHQTAPNERKQSNPTHNTPGE